jgi:hypothetical protein
MWKIVAMLLGLAFFLTAQAAPGKLLRDENLRQDRDGDARVLALLNRGDAVEILDRQGGWLRVGTARGEGWVRLLSVRGDVAAQTAPLTELRGELAPASRRLETRIVAVAGFRGGEEEEKVEAAGRAALARLEGFRLTASEASAAAGSLGLVAGGVAASAACGTPPEVERVAESSGVRLSLMSAWLLNRMGPEDEAKIGRALAARLLIAMPAVDDADLQRYLNRVGAWVIAAQGGGSEVRGLFAVLDSNEINAWSTPGGHVFISRGLYRQLRDEAELAAVLAREVARLADKRLLQALRQHAGGGRPRDEAGFLRQLLGDGLDALQRPDAAECEYQADRAAVLLAARAGYDPYALAGFLQQLSGLPEGDPRLAALARGLPRAETRLARLSNNLEECLAGLPAGKAPPLYRMND